MKIKAKTIGCIYFAILSNIVLADTVSLTAPQNGQNVYEFVSQILGEQGLEDLCDTDIEKHLSSQYDQGLKRTVLSLGTNLTDCRSSTFNRIRTEWKFNTENLLINGANHNTVPMNITYRFNLNGLKFPTVKKDIDNDVSEFLHLLQIKPDGGDKNVKHLYDPRIRVSGYKRNGLNKLEINIIDDLISGEEKPNFRHLKTLTLNNNDMQNTWFELQLSVSNWSNNGTVSAVLYRLVPQKKGGVKQVKAMQLPATTVDLWDDNWGESTYIHVKGGYYAQFNQNETLPVGSLLVDLLSVSVNK